MTTKHLLRSFAGGEITPELAGRLDLVKYQTGLGLCQNFITLPHGPAARRPGTEFIAETKDSAHKVRLIPFTFSADQTAVLEFGHEYIRVHINGGALLEANQSITGITGATVTVPAHGYVAGDWVYIGGKFFIVASATTDTFTVTTMSGLAGAPDGTIAARVFTLATPYQEADLFDLHYAQSADVVTIAHPSYALRELSRQSATDWTLTEVSFAPPDVVPTGVTATPTIASSETDKNKTIAKYVVTAVKNDGVTESLPSAVVEANNNLTLAGNFNTITWDPVDGYSRYNVYKLRGGVYGYIGQVKPTGATPVDIATATAYQSLFSLFLRVRVTTTSAHGFSTGDYVYIQGASKFDGVFQVSVESTTVFTYALASNGGTVTTGTASTPSLSLVDDNVLADTTQSPPEDIIVLNSGEGDYPGTTVYHEQRRWFAGTNLKPQVLWATRTGTDSNLTNSIPSRDADGMEVRVASSQYNKIRHLVALSDMIALTAGGEFRIFADGAPAITPTSISIKPQGYTGASNVQPVVTAGTVMYVQAQGSRVRELSYSWEASAYKTADASIMAPHRFDYHTITDMAFSRAPDSILWAVRDDGLLMGMTYVPEQQVYGWHAHNTDGKFESVTVVPEGNEDMLYAVVKREIDGRSVRYIERFSTRYFWRIEFAYFVDCGSTFSTLGTKEITFVGPNEIQGDFSGSQEVYFDSGVYSCVYHYRKVENDVWVFEDYTFPDVGVRASLRLVDATTKVPGDPILIDGISTFGPWMSGGYSLTETDTDFWLFGWHSTASTSGAIVKISKSDPTDQTVYTTPYRSVYGFATNDGTGAWVLSSMNPHTFIKWDYATQAFTTTRTGPDPSYSESWAVGMFSCEHLPNGDLAYTYRSKFSSPALSRVVFLHPDESYETVDLPTTATVPAALRTTEEADTLWVLTNDYLVKINTATYTTAATYEVPGCSVGTVAGPANIAYAPGPQKFYWFNTSPDYGRDDQNPYLATFDIATGTTTTEVFPPGRVSPDWASDYMYEIGYIDGALWASAFVPRPGTDVQGFAVYVIGGSSNEEVGNTYVYFDQGTGIAAGTGERYEFTILQVLSPTRALVSTTKTIPDALYDIPLDAYYVKVQTISGLDHLEGKTVQILADGAVHPTRVVTNGAISLEYPAAIVTIGLQYTSDIRTLPLAMEGAQAVGQGTMKNVNAVHLRMSKSSLVQAGPTFDLLRGYPARATTDTYGAPPALRDGELAISVDPSWGTDGALCVRQDEPLPLTVVSMTLEVQTGG